MLTLAAVGSGRNCDEDVVLLHYFIFRINLNNSA